MVLEHRFRSELMKCRYDLVKHTNIIQVPILNANLFT
jgi:hypothetical protein